MRFERLSILFILSLLFSCSNDHEKKDSTVTKSEVDSTPEIIDLSIEFSENYSLTPTENGYHLELIDPNSMETEASYELVYDQESNANKNIIQIPIQHVANLSQTSVGMMAILDAYDQLCGISGIQYASDQKVKDLFNEKKLVEIGEETNFPIEKIVSSKADLLLYSGFGNDFPQEKKLKKLGVHVLPNYDWREKHPLGKAEWIKLIGVLCGKEKEALDYFETVRKEYEALKWSVRDVEQRPTVISGNLIGDIWYAPAGQSYMAVLLADAGADYIYANTTGTGSTEKTIEEIIRDNSKTDFWINPSFTSKTKLSDFNPKAKFLHPFENGTYCYSHNMNFYWERSAAEPHRLLSDLIHIFHPEIEQTEQLYFYKKLED